MGFFGGCSGRKEDNGKASLLLITAAVEGPEHFHSMPSNFPWTRVAGGQDMCGVKAGAEGAGTFQRSGRASVQQELLEAAPDAALAAFPVRWEIPAPICRRDHSWNESKRALISLGSFTAPDQPAEPQTGNVSGARWKVT